ncbi:MAG TPA: sugar phosphate nucleotidyltransferase [Bacteroidia bacterium]|jgi:glucose-1-phosphate thymidylyltransferase|nr:sugar phosphate nucleotidyltransferase [Bacteroidia bacterium]
MKIIVPMAGMGKRMRPHTLTIPKPLLPIAGKPIVQRLVEDIAKVCKEPVEEVAFIIGPTFGKEVEASLVQVAQKLGAKGTIYYQEEALGTAHAIYCAQASLSGKVVVAFADTLFKADFKLDSAQEGIIWVQKIEDPRAFGVVKVNAENVITDFVEKPETFVSDLAIIGIYYFRDGDNLRAELKYLLDNNIRDKGEYQLTNALENMKNKGLRFSPGKVSEWLDCGNKNATVYTNQRVLEFVKNSEQLVDPGLQQTGSRIIEPCFIGEHVTLLNATIGPHVSIGAHTTVENSVIKNSIIQENTKIYQSTIVNSMVGSHAELRGLNAELSVGDYNTICNK